MRKEVQPQPRVVRIRRIRRNDSGALLDDDQDVWLLSYRWDVEMSGLAHLCAVAVEPDVPNSVTVHNSMLYVERGADEVRVVFSLLDVLVGRESLIDDLAWQLSQRGVPAPFRSARRIVARAREDVSQMLEGRKPRLH